MGLARPRQRGPGRVPACGLFAGGQTATGLPPPRKQRRTRGTLSLFSPLPARGRDSCHGLTRGMDGDPVTVPLFKIALPSKVGSVVLRPLSRKAKEKSATYQELFDLLHSEDIEGYLARSGLRDN